MKMNDEKVIDYVALGDSLTTGVGILPFDPGFVERYAGLTRGKLNMPVRLYKHDKVGATTSDLLQSLRSDDYNKTVLRHADIITVTIGGNDLIQAGKAFLQNKDENVLFQALDTSIKNISAIITILNELVSKYEGPFIIRLTNLYNPLPQVPQADIWVQKFNEHLQGFSSISNLKVANIYSIFKGNTKTLLSSDGIHPNQQGYDQMARAVYNLGYNPLA
ncbi:GDSL-type esterase/lipase family protein [Jeotgalibacillus marinus]|uniref:GDSL-type esterase/lipase family protein n=1 Tax=Jeotgalibacillus marinus TaxID=86667 RepID=A0ABV3Q5Q6_9BACL